MEEGNRVDDLDTGGGGAAEEDGIDGGGPVLEGVEDELNVSILVDLVARLTTHDDRFERERI